MSELEWDKLRRIVREELEALDRRKAEAEAEQLRRATEALAADITSGKFVRGQVRILKPGVQYLPPDEPTITEG